MKKSDVVRMRLAPEEKEVFEQAAREAGLSISAWMRRHLRVAAGVYANDGGLRHATD